MTDTAQVHQVLTWMLEGNSEHLIREAIAETWPDQEAAPLIFAAIERLSQSASLTHEQVQNWCYEATRFLYSKQVEIGEYAGAMKAIRQMQEISAARTRQEQTPKLIDHRHRHEIAIGPITDANSDEVRECLAQRIAALRDIAGRSGDSRLTDRREGTRTTDRA